MKEILGPRLAFAFVCHEIYTGFLADNSPLIRVCPRAAHSSKIAKGKSISHGACQAACLPCQEPSRPAGYATPRWRMEKDVESLELWPTSTRLAESLASKANCKAYQISRWRDPITRASGFDTLYLYHHLTSQLRAVEIRGCTWYPILYIHHVGNNYKTMPRPPEREVWSPGRSNHWIPQMR